MQRTIFKLQSKITEPAAAKARRRRSSLFGRSRDDGDASKKGSSLLRIGLGTRLKAWYVGAENLEVFSRYGVNNMWRHVYNEWRGACIAGFCVCCVMWNHQTNQRADDVLDAFERNRMKFYKRDFAPEPDANTPQSLYDGAPGYQHFDSKNPEGLKVTMENTYVGPPRKELAVMTEQLEVTPMMVRTARIVRDRTLQESPIQGYKQ